MISIQEIIFDSPAATGYGYWVDETFCLAASGSDGVETFANPACLLGNAAATSQPNTQQPAAPTCSISLYDRPVPTNNSAAAHSYLLVTDSGWSNDPAGLLVKVAQRGTPSSAACGATILSSRAQAWGLARPMPQIRLCRRIVRLAVYTAEGTLAALLSSC